MKKLTCVLITLLVALNTVAGCSRFKDSNLQNLVKSATEKTLTIIPGNNVGGNGDVDPSYGSHPYKSHERVIVTATPRPGSLFAGWQGIEGVLTTMSAVDPSKPSSWLDYKIEVVMKQDVTLIPLFFQAHSLDISIQGGGLVRISKVEGLGGADDTRFKGDILKGVAGGNLYYAGELVTFTAIPDAGSVFAGWTWAGDMNQVDPKYLPPKGPFSGEMTVPLDRMATTVTMHMGRDIRLTANFVRK